MEFLITICGRGGSKGIPNKNIKLLNGVPLIVYTINAAKSFQKVYNSDIGISTDSDEILKVAAEYGLSTDYKRPEEFATDVSGKLKVIEELLKFEEKKHNKKYDFVLDLDITSPLRNQNDLIFAFKLFQEDKNALNLFSVNVANRNPYFNMVEKNTDGYYELVKKGEFLTRQSAPDVYDLNASFYFFRRDFFSQPTPMINIRSLIYVMPHICFDLDHPIDFEFMEYLLANDKLGFSL